MALPGRLLRYSNNLAEGTQRDRVGFWVILYTLQGRLLQRAILVDTAFCCKLPLLQDITMRESPSPSPKAQQAETLEPERQKKYDIM